MTSRRPTCRTYEVDGQPVVVRGNRPLNDEDQAALAEIVRAAKRKLANDERCELTELLVEQCGCAKHRGGRTPQEEANAEALHDPSGRWIEARYPGRCAECGKPFQPGTRIRASRSDVPHWIAECCAEEDDGG